MGLFSVWMELLSVVASLLGPRRAGNRCQSDDLCGTVFSLDAATGVETALYSFQSPPDSANPVAGLANLQGTLYGTTEAGGTYNRGAVFSINPTTGQETVQHLFESGGPYAGLTRVGGTLYGATTSRVFAFKPATGSFRPVR